METTKLSTKGQIVLPQHIRASKAWRPGTEFTIEETADGILLRPAKRIARTTLDEVFGCLGSKRKSRLSARQIRSAVESGVMKRHDRGRY